MPAFGIGGREKRTTPIVGLTHAVTEMAKAIITQQQAGQTTPAQPTTSGSTSTGVSPAKLASLRSNYLQQMRDLHSLYETGAITEPEFFEQKAPILEQLKTLRPV